MARGAAGHRRRAGEGAIGARKTAGDDVEGTIIIDDGCGATSGRPPPNRGAILFLFFLAPVRVPEQGGLAGREERRRKSALVLSKERRRRRKKESCLSPFALKKRRRRKKNEECTPLLISEISSASRLFFDAERTTTTATFFLSLLSSFAAPRIPKRASQPCTPVAWPRPRAQVSSRAWKRKSALCSNISIARRLERKVLASDSSVVAFCVFSRPLSLFFRFLFFPFRERRGIVLLVTLGASESIQRSSKKQKLTHPRNDHKQNVDVEQKNHRRRRFLCCFCCPPLLRGSQGGSFGSSRCPLSRRDRTGTKDGTILAVGEGERKEGLLPPRSSRFFFPSLSTSTSHSLPLLFLFSSSSSNRSSAP